MAYFRALDLRVMFICALVIQKKKKSQKSKTNKQVKPEWLPTRTSDSSLKSAEPDQKPR